MPTPEGWTRDGYCSALLAAGVPVHTDLAGALVPEWAGALALVLIPVLPERDLAALLRAVGRRPDRETFAAIARMAGAAAVLPLVPGFLNGTLGLV